MKKTKKQKKQLIKQATLILTVQVLANIACKFLADYRLKTGSDYIDSFSLSLIYLSNKADELLRDKVCPNLGVCASDITLDLDTIEHFLSRPDVLIYMHEVINKAMIPKNLSEEEVDKEISILITDLYEHKDL